MRLCRIRGRSRNEDIIGRRRGRCKRTKIFDRQVQRQILKFLRERVASLEYPHAIGETLTGGMKGLWKYRVGPCRLIGDIQGQHVRVLGVRIGHRRGVYR